MKKPTWSVFSLIHVVERGLAAPQALDGHEGLKCLIAGHAVGVLFAEQMREAAIARLKRQQVVQKRAALLHEAPVCAGIDELCQYMGKPDSRTIVAPSFPESFQ